MDFSFRSEKTSGKSEPERVNPQQHVFAATPLNYVPYIGPPKEQINNAPTPNKCETEAAGNVGPAILFLPQHSTREEWNNILATTTSGVALTGSAATRQVGPIVGLVDIGESEESYLFRVSLPGVAREENDFNCNIDPDGKILINGVTTTGEQVVCKDSQVFRMQTQNLCLPGRFSISFQLPGPVNNQRFTRNFGTNGILEGMVKKR
ncbi:hypothetical protein Ddye_028301 [Dipteronia dyeriana]|uniref:SHSP domain-containing protein n=1 Tax=Dipteronia dyeriana TaxID=168575 RepID=A0AAD9TRE5_9ROSI|nr:hypothetical protein Ddye_028301 [Dipteronia dyeriana]